MFYIRDRISDPDSSARSEHARDRDPPLASTAVEVRRVDSIRWCGCVDASRRRVAPDDGAADSRVVCGEYSSGFRRR